MPDEGPQQEAYGRARDLDRMAGDHQKQANDAWTRGDTHTGHREDSRARELRSAAYTEYGDSVVGRTAGGSPIYPDGRTGSGQDERPSGSPIYTDRDTFGRPRMPRR